MLAFAHGLMDADLNYTDLGLGQRCDRLDLRRAVFESLWVTFPAACGVSPGHDQRLRQEARPGLPEATREPPIGSLLKYSAACGGDPLFPGSSRTGRVADWSE